MVFRRADQLEIIGVSTTFDRNCEQAGVANRRRGWCARHRLSGEAPTQIDAADLQAVGLDGDRLGPRSDRQPARRRHQ
jgi:hypothetical protein